MAELGEDIATLNDRFERYPQVLRNIRVEEKKKLMNDPRLAAPMKEAERLLSGKGRMLLRPSGTEPLLRIFVESRDAALMDKVADMLEAEINSVIKAGF